MLTAGSRTQAWDYDNRLSSVTASGSTTSMVYDYTGMRTEKNGPLGTTIFPFSGYEIGPGGISVKYIRIGIENVASKKSTGEKFFYHNDHLGGVNVITNTSGVLAQLIEYDPWGKISRSEGTGDSLRRFTGKILDPESGLLYYGGRYYDADLGRWISPDPFVPQFDDPQSLNRYSYVVNNPQNYIDPDGYSHEKKKKKKKGGIFRKIFGFIAGIVVGWFTGGAGFALAELAGFAEAAGTIGGFIGGAFGGATAAGIAGGDPGLGALFGGLAGGFLGAVGLGPDGSMFGDSAQSANSGFIQLASAEPDISLTITSRAALANAQAVQSAISPFDFIGPGLFAGIARGVGTVGAALGGQVITRGLAGAVAESALLRASQAAANATIPTGRLAHILARHAFGSSALNASKFAQGANMPTLINKALQSDLSLIRPGVGGRFVFEHTFSSSIGTDIAGQVTPRLRVVLDPGGTVITAFPF